MARPVFDPSLLAVQVTPRGADLLTKVLRFDHLVTVLGQTRDLTDSQRREALAAWQALYTIARMPRALNAAQQQESAPVVDDPREALLSTEQAAVVLGVTEGRVRQMFRDGELTKVNDDKHRHLFDPQQVQRLALERSGRSA